MAATSIGLAVGQQEKNKTSKATATSTLLSSGSASGGDGGKISDTAAKLYADNVSKFQTPATLAGYKDSPGPGVGANLPPSTWAMNLVKTAKANDIPTSNAHLGALSSALQDASGTPRREVVTPSEEDTKNKLYGMRDEMRFSEAQMGLYRDAYSKMKGGRVAPAAQLLSPYRGYGGPRSTAIGNPNVQTATKMLLGS